jgi:hypothetical protein
MYESRKRLWLTFSVWASGAAICEIADRIRGSSLGKVDISERGIAGWDPPFSVDSGRRSEETGNSEGGQISVDVFAVNRSG